MILVFAIDGDVYFQVMDDKRKYYDLDGVETVHPELRTYIYENRFRLNREFSQKKELLQM